MARRGDWASPAARRLGGPCVEGKMNRRRLAGRWHGGGFGASPTVPGGFFGYFPGGGGFLPGVVSSFSALSNKSLVPKTPGNVINFDLCAAPNFLRTVRCR